ncbi:hypothetical protein LEP1GSC188_3111 [Leptospira weilii serovar Topaz str. LT2116]|uniref:Uncharacterized protein n=1 Tax=Leptospira weilii serovar Topaz str. LT2116 TaxID=1088540 RepID=M3GVI0_9LEPT|nr:hypothetical protein LEP1GSC188_3111 [Leptospira weilii serovar Topaz str. LT2116]
MIIIFLSIMLGASVALFSIFLFEENKDRKFRKLLNSNDFLKPPFDLEAIGKVDVAHITEEIVKKLSDSPGDISEKLQGFLNSLKFHDRVLEGIFQKKSGSPDHYAIGRELESLINEVELRIRILKEEESYESSSN